VKNKTINEFKIDVTADIKAFLSPFVYAGCTCVTDAFVGKVYRRRKPPVEKRGPAA